MPTIKSSKKRMHLSRAANLRNRARRSSIRTAIKRVRNAETAEEAEKRLRHVISLLDRPLGPISFTPTVLPASRDSSLDT